MDRACMNTVYLSMLNEKAIQQDNMRRFLRACDMVIEGYIDEEILNEASSAKTIWEKFTTWVKQFFAKFAESFNNLISNNKEWLERYRDIILTKKPKEGSTVDDFPDYATGIKRITDCTVPLLQYEAMKNDMKSYESMAIKICPGLSGDISTYFPDGLSADNTGTGGFTKYFVGGEPRDGVDITSLNFTDMYNFCYNAEKILSNIKKDTNTIESSTKNFETMVNSLETQAGQDAAKADQAAGTNSVPKPAEGNDTDKDKDGAGDSDKSNDQSTQENKMDQETFNKLFQYIQKEYNAVNSKFENAKKLPDNQRLAQKSTLTQQKQNYEATFRDSVTKNTKLDEDQANKLNQFHPSNIKESSILDDPRLYDIIYEIKVNAGKDDNSSSSSSSASSAVSNKVLTANTGNTGSVTDNKASAKAAYDKAGNANSTAAEKLEEISKNVTVYRNITTSVMTAKTSAVNTIFNGYMELLRAHVRSIVGNEANVDTKTASAGTDYNNRYSQTRKNDFETAKNKYTAAQDGTDAKKNALADYVATAKKIYGQTEWDKALKQGGSEAAAAEKLYTAFMGGYNAATGQSQNQNNNEGNNTQ